MAYNSLTMPGMPSKGGSKSDKLNRGELDSIRFDLAGRPEFSFWPKDASLTSLGKNKKLLTDNLNVNITLGFSERLRAAREKRLGGK